MNSITKLSTATALAFVSFAAQAGIISQTYVQVDVDGAGGMGAVNVDVFDFAPGNVLADNSLTAFTTGDNWNIYAQSKLAALNFGGSSVTPSGLDTDWEFTSVLSFTETILTTLDLNGNGFDELAIFGFASTQTNNYFELWADNTPNADNLTGSGMNDGTLILAGTIIGIGVSNFTIDESSLPLSLLTGNPADDNTKLDGSGALELLDQSPNGDDWSGQKTLEGAGITGNVQIEVTFTDPDYIKLDPASIIVFDLNLGNASQTLPFKQVDPATCFVSSAGGNGASVCDADATSPDATGLNPELGLTANGFGGNDFIFQTDINASIYVQRVPEPGSMALLGLGLTAMGFAATRRRKKNA